MEHRGYQGPWPPAPAPVHPAAADRVHRWFVVYVVAMVVLYLVCSLAGGFALVYDFGVTASDAVEIRIQAGIFLVVCAAMLAVFAVGLFLPRRSWAWVYGLVLIGLGLTSCCTWPITIPLIIRWLKPEMKARFGRS